VVQYFLDNDLISQTLAENLLSWKNSGFSIDNSIQLYSTDKKARESLAQYIVRCPISLKKIIYEPFKGKVIFHTKYNAYFKENTKLFDAADFIAELTQHIPPLRMRLVRYYGLYSSRSRWKWQEWGHVLKHAPDGWKKKNSISEKPQEEQLDAMDQSTVISP